MFSKKRLPFSILIEKTLKAYSHYFFMFFIMHAILGISNSILARVFGSFILMTLFFSIFCFFMIRVSHELIEHEFYGFGHTIADSWKKYVFSGLIYFFTVFSIYYILWIIIVLILSRASLLQFLFHKNSSLLLNSSFILGLSFLQIIIVLPLLSYVSSDRKKLEMSRYFKETVLIMKYNFFKLLFMQVAVNYIYIYLLKKSSLYGSMIYNFAIDFILTCLILPIFIVYLVCMHKMQLQILKKYKN